jgi:hypothetical protein
MLEALSNAKTPEEQKMILAKIGGVKGSGIPSKQPSSSDLLKLMNPEITRQDIGGMVKRMIQRYN